MHDWGAPDEHAGLESKASAAPACVVTECGSVSPVACCHVTTTPDWTSRKAGAYVVPTNCTVERGVGVCAAVGSARTTTSTAAAGRTPPHVRTATILGRLLTTPRVSRPRA